MKIGITSQNFRTITGHAGKARRFLIYSVSASGEPKEEERLDLPIEMSMHEHRGNDHPLYRLDVLITGGCGQGFLRRMASHGVEVIATAEKDPAVALTQLIKGAPLPPAEPHEHSHNGDQSHPQRASDVKIQIPGQQKVTVKVGKQRQ